MDFFSKKRDFEKYFFEFDKNMCNFTIMRLADVKDFQQ